MDKHFCDIRDNELFYDALAEYICLGLNPREIMRRLAIRFPREKIPSEPIMTVTVKSRLTWTILRRRHGAEEANRLWELHKSRLRTVARGRLAPQDDVTLEEKLTPKARRRPPPPGARGAMERRLR